MKSLIGCGLVGALLGLVAGHPGPGALLGVGVWALPRVERALDGVLRVAASVAVVAGGVLLVGLVASGGRFG